MGAFAESGTTVNSLGTSHGDPTEGIAARGRVFECLSILYGPPDETFLKDEPLMLLGKGLDQCGLDTTVEMRELVGYLTGLQGLGTLETTAKEYVRLFRGPVKAAVYPYESMHVDGELMGPSTLAVVDSYEESGICLSEDFKDLPDHVSAELEFMHYLYAMEFYACQSRNQAAQQWFQHRRVSFLQEHISKWIPDFAEAVLGSTASPFYRALALITAKFLRQEITLNSVL